MTWESLAYRLVDVLRRNQDHQCVHERLESNLVMEGILALLHAELQQEERQHLHLRVLDKQPVMDGLCCLFDSGVMGLTSRLRS